MRFFGREPHSVKENDGLFPLESGDAGVGGVPVLTVDI